MAAPVLDSSSPFTNSPLPLTPRLPRGPVSPVAPRRTAAPAVRRGATGETGPLGSRGVKGRGEFVKGLLESRTGAAIVERYLLLSLRLGRHIDGFVDFYYGPPELAQRVKGEESAICRPPRSCRLPRGWRWCCAAVPTSASACRRARQPSSSSS